MVEVRLKKGESGESLLRRFHRKIQQSGILIRARKIKFYEKPKSKRLRREEAQRRAEIFKEREKMRKLGKLDLEEFKNRKFY